MSFKKYCKYIAWATGVITLVAIGFLIPTIWRAVKALEHYERGQQLTEAGDYEAAIAEYDKAISIKPDFAQAWVNRGFAQGKLGRHLDKFSSCAQATKVAPNFPEAWNCKGLARFDLKQYELALKEYDRAIAVDNEFYRGWFNQSEILFKLERYEEAIEKFDKVLEIQPDNVVAFAGKIAALEKLGKLKEIRKQCQRRGWTFVGGTCLDP